MGKAFLDAMKGYILPDDNREWVRKVSHEFLGKREYTGGGKGPMGEQTIPGPHPPLLLLTPAWIAASRSAVSMAARGKASTGLDGQETDVCCRQMPGRRKALGDYIRHRALPAGKEESMTEHFCIMVRRRRQYGNSPACSRARGAFDSLGIL